MYSFQMFYQKKTFEKSGKIFKEVVHAKLCFEGNLLVKLDFL